MSDTFLSSQVRCFCWTGFLTGHFSLLVSRSFRLQTGQGEYFAENQFCTPVQHSTVQVYITKGKTYFQVFKKIFKLS